MWRFKKLTPGDPERDPHEAEFFHTNDVAEAVVREFIQNSLDAKCEKKAIIRFTFEKTSKKEILIFLKHLDEHLKAANFYHSDYTSSDDVPFLAIEDFGTTGLDGETGETGERPEGKNNFYNFWWYEGKSQKSGKERGRWGLGKTTFHVASKIRLFIGLTIRRDDKRKLLMGKALLKTHKIDKDTFTYNGYFTDENYKPFLEENLIKQFTENFALLRDGEPGFSLVIPVPHKEITGPRILKSVMIHYFYPILKNSLEIMLRYNEIEEELNANNLIELASQQEWTGTSWEKVNVKDLLVFIQSAIKETTIFDLKINDLANPEISKDSFGEKLDDFREEFNAGRVIAFRIPVEIKEKDKDVIKSYFDVYIQKKRDIPADEFYTRSGITISDIQLLTAYPVRALFIAEDETIAKFLGDAETPAHTSWIEKTEGFKDKYEHAARKLRFVKRGLPSIINYIYLPPKEQKKDFLKELFYVSVEPESEQDSENGKSGKVMEPIPEPKPKKYHIQKISGGFKITKSKNEVTPPLKFKIVCAYDTRKGNPFKNYEPYDFDLISPDFKMNFSGCIVIERKVNKVGLLVQDKEFEFEVTGFDPVRDLIVDIKEID